MKKWHMESIVSLSGGTQKLALPESTHMQVEVVRQIKEPGKEFFLVPVFRSIIGVIVRQF